MERKRYFVNNVMFIFGLSYFVVLVAVAISLFTISRPGSAAIFLALALSFGFIGFRYGSTVEFGADGSLPDPCTSCNWLPICHGGCKKDITAGCHNEPENYFCPAYRFFFEYASERLMEVAREEFRAMQEQGRK